MTIVERYKEKTRVIVVDDNADAVEMFCDFLELNGIQVMGKGYDGFQAVELYKKFKPDIVFLDVMMPNYDGFFGLEQIRKVHENSKIIMVTADVREDTTEKLSLSKPNAIVYKPYDFDKLLETIDVIKNFGIVQCTTPQEKIAP